MIDPQWNILYWGSKWNLHTVCWGAVGCEWGSTSVYLGITHVWFIPSWLPVFTVKPQYQHPDLLFLWKLSFEGHTQNLKKIHVGLKFEWGSQDKYWLSWELLPFEVFFSCPFGVLPGLTYTNMLVATQWPLKRAAHITSPAWVCVVWRSKSSLELAALWTLALISTAILLLPGAPYINNDLLNQHWDKGMDK